MEDSICPGGILGYGGGYRGWVNWAPLQSCSTFPRPVPLVSPTCDARRIRDHTGELLSTLSAGSLLSLRSGPIPFLVSVPCLLGSDMMATWRCSVGRADADGWSRWSSPVIQDDCTLRLTTSRYFSKMMKQVGGRLMTISPSALLCKKVDSISTWRHCDLCLAAVAMTILQLASVAMGL